MMEVWFTESIAVTAKPTFAGVRSRAGEQVMSIFGNQKTLNGLSVAGVSTIIQARLEMCRWTG